MLKRNKVIISGLVQGVFFRRFIYDHATQLGLKGYVRNLDTGKVEAVFQGPEEKIKEILTLCKQGPSGSRVENLKVIKEPLKKDASFKRLN
jgi:acylphosphatase